jgi:hypothetical protein
VCVFEPPLPLARTHTREIRGIYISSGNIGKENRYLLPFVFSLSLSGACAEKIFYVSLTPTMFFSRTHTHTHKEYKRKGQNSPTVDEFFLSLASFVPGKLKINTADVDKYKSESLLG